MSDTRTGELARLTAEVMTDKKAAAASLTPVEGETAPASLPRTPAMFPNDMPQEVVEQKVAELTRIIGHLTEARDALAALVDVPPVDDVVDLAAEKKKRERDADERNFNAEFEAQKAAAQAATFEGQKKAGNAGEAEEADVVNPEPSTWLCPDHGKAVEKPRKAGGTYLGCPDCNQFQR